VKLALLPKKKIFKMTRRVVITGLGIISSIGIGKEKFWSSLIKGTSGITKISSFDTANFPTHYGGEVKNFSPEDFIAKNKLNKMGRASALAVSSARLAWEDANSAWDNLDLERIGVCLGTTMGETQIIEELNETWLKDGPESMDARLIPQTPAYTLSRNIAKEFKLGGPNIVIANACAAGNFAIGYACDLIKNNEADIMLAGGADAFSKIAFTGFNRLLAVAPSLCQPFDKNRKGMLVGEGAAIVVLETLEAALKRKCNIYAEVLGYGTSCDAHHMTAPEHNGIAGAIEKALKESNLVPADVDYFNAHGTGTPSNDREECLAIKKVFGDDYKKVPVSSIKSMLGHTMGAASAIETVACCLALQNDIIPPTINYETPDPECDIDCVPNVTRQKKLNIVLNSSSAFGGNNACLVLKKHPS
jgi:3-oxoacyl-[acyl-carrier-protein] synthase II